MLLRKQSQGKVPFLFLAINDCLLCIHEILKHNSFFFLCWYIRHLGLNETNVQYVASNFNSLTPYDRVMSDNLVLPQLLTNVPIFYGNHSFCAVFKTACHSHSTSHEFIPCHAIIFTEDPFYFTFHLCLGFPRISFLSRFTIKTCIHFSHIPCVLHAPPISSSFI